VQERKCFVCGKFGYITCNCRNVKSRRGERSISMLLNKFKVLTSRVMNMGVPSGGEVRKDRRTI